MFRGLLSYEPVPLPTREDFDAWDGCLDAQHAWKRFGGLTLDQANAKFREAPDIYQEDFMFMGGRAFAFYFPVIESYLRESPAYVEDDDREAWILAKVIDNQFEVSLSDVLPLASRVLDLAHFVKANIDRFDPEPNPEYDVAVAWQEMEDRIKTILRRNL